MANPVTWTKRSQTPTPYSKIPTNATYWVPEDDDPSAGSLLLQDNTTMDLQNGVSMALQLQ